MTGIQTTLTPTMAVTKILATTTSSTSDGGAESRLPSLPRLLHIRRRWSQTSMVKMVEAELKIDVREVIRAAIITASISPANPEEMDQYKAFTPHFLMGF